MGIPLRDKRRRGRRRSYADYRPPNRESGPRNDPFRIIFYLVLIAGGIWVYFNRDMVRAEIFEGGEGGISPVSVAAPRSAPAADVTPAADLSALAEQAYQEGQLTQAVDYYYQAAQAAPEQVDNYVQIARLLVFESAVQYGDRRLEMLDEALQAANNAILADPFDPAGYAIMGKVYDWQGRPDQASSTILQALDIDPEYALAHSYLAEALVDLQRWDQAQESIDRALALQPDHVDIRRDYGYILETLGDYSAAATQYETALRLHPKLSYLHMALGRIYRELGRYDDALDRFFEAQLISPTNALIVYEIGRTYEIYIGDPNSAMEYYQRSTDLDASYGSPWLRMGTLRYFEGRYADAIVAFERALALDAVSPDLYFQIGLAYAYEGRCDTALTYLEQAQSQAPEDERIQDAVQTGFEVCSQPTPVPVDVLGTPTPGGESSGAP